MIAISSILFTLLFVWLLFSQIQNRDLSKALALEQVTSPSNEIAAKAVATLRNYGWLSDGTLRGTNLTLANLEGLSLIGADMQDVEFVSANLRGVDLSFANLSGADLLNARLEGALLNNTIFDERTILPDGEGWALEEDLSRFTDPKHPQFRQILPTPTAFVTCGTSLITTFPPPTYLDQYQKFFIELSEGDRINVTVQVHEPSSVSEITALFDLELINAEDNRLVIETPSIGYSVQFISSVPETGRYAIAVRAEPNIEYSLAVECRLQDGTIIAPN